MAAESDQQPIDMTKSLMKIREAMREFVGENPQMEISVTISLRLCADIAPYDGANVQPAGYVLRLVEDRTTLKEST